VLVETGILAWEFNDLMGDIEGGSLTRAATEGAAGLARTWPAEDASAQQYLAAAAEALAAQVAVAYGGKR